MGCRITKRHTADAAEQIVNCRSESKRKRAPGMTAGNFRFAVSTDAIIILGNYIRFLGRLYLCYPFREHRLLNSESRKYNASRKGEESQTFACFQILGALFLCEARTLNHSSVSLSVCCALLQFTSLSVSRI